MKPRVQIIGEARPVCLLLTGLHLVLAGALPTSAVGQVTPAFAARLATNTMQSAGQQTQQDPTQPSPALAAAAQAPPGKAGPRITPSKIKPIGSTDNQHDRNQAIVRVHLPGQMLISGSAATPTLTPQVGSQTLTEHDAEATAPRTASGLIIVPSNARAGTPSFQPRNAVTGLGPTHNEQGGLRDDSAGGIAGCPGCTRCDSLIRDGGAPGYCIATPRRPGPGRRELSTQHSGRPGRVAGWAAERPSDRDEPRTQRDDATAFDDQNSALADPFSLHRRAVLRFAEAAQPRLAEQEEGHRRAQLQFGELHRSAQLQFHRATLTPGVQRGPDGLARDRGSLREQRSTGSRRR